MTTTTKKRDVRGEFAAALAELLTDATSSPEKWVKTWSGCASNGWPTRVGEDRYAYSGGNALYLLLTAWKLGLPEGQWGTFNQIAEACGLKRKGKGRKATWVDAKGERAEHPIIAKGAKSTVLIRPSIKTEEDDAGEKTSTFVGWRAFRVFHTSQSPLWQATFPEVEPEDTVDPSVGFERCAALLQRLQGQGLVLQKGGSRACYNLRTEQVSIPLPSTFTHPGHYWSCLWHEVTHWTGHKTRLGRHESEQYSGPFGSEGYAREELVAEVGAALLLVALQVTDPEAYKPRHAGYLAGWLKAIPEGDARNEALRRSAAEAIKASSYLLPEEVGDLDAEELVAIAA